jgi:glutamate dehydrogenase/leucine dehydrogenase
VHDPDGIDPALAHEHKRNTGALRGLAGCSEISNAELLAHDCDILIPAALENQLRGDNAADVKARLVVELANGPTTPEADAVLEEKNVRVIPDILANAGGVTVSYYEWVQNNKNEQWDEEDVNTRLERIMTRATDAVLDKQARTNESLEELTARRRELGRDGDPLDPVDLRTAAFLVALERVAQVTLERGIWP